MKDSFVFYRSFFEALTGMDKESQADCLMAIADYALNDKEPDLTPEVRMFFTLVKPQIDANKKRFENGSKGGRPKKPNNNLEVSKIEPNNNQKETKPKPNVNDNVNVNVNINDIREYAKQRDRLDLVEKFYDYYSATGWRDKDGKKVKNWKAKFITWENRNAKPIEKPDAVELYLQIDNQKREEQQRLASAAEKAMELARQKAMNKFGG